MFAPGPVIVASDEIFGSTLVKEMVPVSPVRSIASEPTLLPARHSPAVAPEAALLLAAAIASRKVHKPSVPFASSEVLLTVMVFPAAVVIKLVCGWVAAKLSELGRVGFFAEPILPGKRRTNANNGRQMEMKQAARIREDMGDDNTVILLDCKATS